MNDNDGSDFRVKRINSIFANMGNSETRFEFEARFYFVK